MGQQELAAPSLLRQPSLRASSPTLRVDFAGMTCDLSGGVVEEMVQGSDRDPERTFESMAAGSEEKALFLP